MSRPVTFFPPYSQKENVVTNAVLVLLANVYRLAPTLLEDALCSLTEEVIPLGPTFQNQISGKGKPGIPDALIGQDAFQIFIETKLGKQLDQDQLKRHVDSIAESSDRSGNQYLLGITCEPIVLSKYEQVERYARNKKVKFIATTFRDIADVFNRSTAEFRIHLNELVKEFEAFLVEQDLQPMTRHRLIVNPCGATSDLNLEFGVYHDQPERSKDLCRYIGIYTNKSVVAIGEVKRVLLGKLNGDAFGPTAFIPLPWSSEAPPPLDNSEMKRIRGIIDRSPYDHLGIEDARYYLVDEFVETDFRKTSKHGIMGHRYFDLEEHLEGLFVEEKRPSVHEIAEELRVRTWE